MSLQCTDAIQHSHSKNKHDAGSKMSNDNVQNLIFL